MNFWPVTLEHHNCLYRTEGIQGTFLQGTHRRDTLAMYDPRWMEGKRAGIAHRGGVSCA